MKTKFLTALAVSFFTAFPSFAGAIEPVEATETVANADESDWDYSITPFLWATALSGRISNGSVSADVDIGFSAILENLEIAAMVDFRARKGRWEYGGNLVYSDLSTSSKGISGAKRTIGSKTTIIEADAKYYFSEQLFAYGGARYYSVGSTAKIGAPVSAKASSTNRWVDPIVGGGFALPIADNWNFVGKGDIGGFGLGSDFAWQAQAYIQYNSSDKISILAGYRVLNYDYTGSGTRLNLTMSGPVFGVRIKF